MTKEPVDYWFARRFPIGSARGGMAPINWKGNLVAIAFGLGLLGAGVVAYWFASNEQMLKGIASFAFLAFMLGLWFIGISHKKGDHVHTVADYREGKVRV